MASTAVNHFHMHEKHLFKDIFFLNHNVGVCFPQYVRCLLMYVVFCPSWHARSSFVCYNFF
eukprot:c29286_g1_i1 orf=192-374(-)